MTATTVPATAAKVRLTAEERRARILGVIYFALSAFVLWAFALGVSSDLDATFKTDIVERVARETGIVVNAERRKQQPQKAGDQSAIKSTESDGCN